MFLQIFAVFVLFQGILGKSHYYENGLVSLQKHGAACVLKLKWEFSEISPQDVAQWHVMEYPETDASHCMINCVLKKGQFLDADENLDAAKFHATFDNLPLDEVQRCAAEGEAAVKMHSCDRAYLPFACLLKSYRKEILNKFYGTDEVFENSEQIKADYEKRAQEIFESV